MNEFNPGDGWREVPPEDRRAEVQWYGNPAGLDPVKAWVRVEPVPPLPTEPWSVIRVAWRENVQRLSDDELVLHEEGWRDTDNRAMTAADLAERITGFVVLAEPRAVTAQTVLDRVRQELPLGHDAPSLRYIDEIAREFEVES